METNEKSHSQTFWLKLIREKFGIINPEEYIEFEKRVDIVHKKFIDAYVPSTGIIIEQKFPGKNLDDAFIQAKNYHDWLPLSQRGRYIITCDFNEIHIHDMEEPTASPQIIAVEDATKDNLSLLLMPGETRSLEAMISIIRETTLYDFGVLTSRVHMAWVRRVSGRLKSDYSYSNTVVYNTFAWPSPTPKQRAKIEATAQKIIDARKLYPDSSFAAMYDEVLMPPELRRAHERNDRAVCRAYRWNEEISEEDIVAELFRLYHKIVGRIEKRRQN